MAAKKIKKTKAASKSIDTMPSVSAQDDSWKHEDDARTLKSAAEIMNDPERMKNAHKAHKKQKKAFKSVDDLIAYRNEKSLKPDLDEDGE